MVHLGEQYNLYAAVVHCGSDVDSGHYYTYAKDSEEWYKFNDCAVILSSESELCNLRPPETPYILFYSRLVLLEFVQLNQIFPTIVFMCVLDVIVWTQRTYQGPHFLQN